MNTLNELKTLTRVADEVTYQGQAWGVQDHPDLPKDPAAGDPELMRSMYAAYAHLWKKTNGARAADGAMAWDGILLEEVYEALELAGLEEHDEDLIGELVQVAAVAVSWIDAIQRRRGVEA